MNAGASTYTVPSPIEGSGTAWVLLGSWALSPARPTPIHPRHECRGLSALFGEQSFLFQELVELRHVVGVDTEDAKRLQHSDVPGPRHILRDLRLAAALEAEIVALEPHTAPEELDDLRTLGGTHVHQRHRAHSPAIPALGEFLRSNEQVHR